MKRIFLYSIFLLGFSSVFATDAQRTIDSIINRIDPNMNIGISVVDLDTGSILYQRNANRAFTPASNMKLYSDAAAILALGPDYQFKSSLSTNADMIDNGVLKGNLYLHLSGDPSFNQDDLGSLFRKLQSLGLKQIQGNIYIVSANESVDPYPPGWMKTDLRYSYGAPIAPLVIDENRLSVTINPGSKEGSPVLVELARANPNVIINNLAKTKGNGKGCGLAVNLDHDNKLTVSGCIGIGQWAVQQKMAVLNPLGYGQGAIKQQLANLNIALNGQILLGSAPANALLLASHLSKPISQLMADTLKPSDNLYADSLYLHAAAVLAGHELNWAQAQPVVKSFLQQQTGINMQNAILVDGSGLSLQDRVSPEQTVRLLRFLHERFPLAYEYIAALPIAGVDGTLQKRFRKPNQQGFMRAKTGTMTGISSLSGYLYTANAHTLAFSIFINKTAHTKNGFSGRLLIESLCDFLLQHKPSQVRMADAPNAHGRVAFQGKPNHLEIQRSNLSKWRKLEYAVKQAVQGQAVSVIYRGNELVLNDNNVDPNKVWAALQNIRRRYNFAVSLQGNTAPSTKSQPYLLWIKTNGTAGRMWTLGEAG